MRVYAALFGMVLGLGFMLLGGFGALYASTFGMFMGYTFDEITLTFLGGFVLLIVSIYTYPDAKPAEKEEPEVVPEWPLEERHYQ